MRGRARESYLRARRVAGRVYRRLAPSPNPRPTGRAPQVTRESTNLGPVVDDVVLRARRRMRVGVDPDHDLVNQDFDALHYLLQRPELMGRDEGDLVDHFLAHGETEELSPQPHFSMATYLRQHPEARHTSEPSPYLEWRKRGRSAGQFADPVPRPDLIAPLLGMDPSEVVDRAVDRRTDLQRRLRSGRLGEMVARAAEVEPLIGAAWPAMTRPLLMPLTSLDVVGGMSALHRSHEAAGFRRARVVLVVNQARRAADLGMEGHLTHALREHLEPDDIVVIHTDNSVEGATDRHPPGVRQVDFARFASGMEQDEDLEQVLVTLIRSFGADSVVNIRSRLLFRAMRTYTPALTASERLFICLSGNEQSPMGTWDGWGPHYFYRTFDRIAGVITDNAYFVDYLTATYQLPEHDRQRIHLLRTPVSADAELVATPTVTGERRPQVFWVGRWGRQRKVDTLLALAGRMPDVDFRVWGQGRLPGPEAPGVPPNLRFEPGSAKTRELPLHEADLWLHTATWDSVPAQLLEVATTGVPIVGTLVGGTSEVMTAQDAWPVSEDAGDEAYEAAIRAVLADPQAARHRAGGLRARMVRERAAAGFAAEVGELLLTAGEEPR